MEGEKKVFQYHNTFSRAPDPTLMKLRPYTVTKM
jgi:hypothetical protein